MGFHEWLRNSGFQELEIQVNWDSLLDNKNSVKEWDALLKFSNGEIEDVILRAEVSVRGKYRRRICEVPPMDIDIKKSELRRLGLSTKSDEYKLVTHCKDELRKKQLVEIESIIYLMYQDLSPQSYFSHQLGVRYTDQVGNEKTSGAGIILESSKELSNRLQMEKFEGLGRQDSIHSYNKMAFTIFQCMIANHDWNIGMQKNVKLFRDSVGNYFAVPYDFDFSGLVSAPYLTLRTDLGLKRAMDRYFFAEKIDRTIFETVWEDLEARKAKFIQRVDSHPTLKASEKKRLKKEIDYFYSLRSRIISGERKFSR